MEEFELPVIYNNEELLLPARFLKYTYSYKIEVTVDGEKIFFEPDEEGGWRVLIEERLINSKSKIKQDFLSVVLAAIGNILK